MPDPLMIGDDPVSRERFERLYGRSTPRAAGPLDTDLLRELEEKALVKEQLAAARRTAAP